VALAASLLAHGALLGALPGAGAPVPAPSSPALHAMLAETPSAIAPQPQPAPRRSGLRQAPRYFMAEELDQRPLIQSQVDAQFPVLALAPTGRVLLRLYVGEDGRVERIAVESGDPTGAFEAAARTAFGSARFLPGMKDGVAVKALLRIEVLFGTPHPDNG
jgi:periplasmic protein TonB